MKLPVASKGTDLFNEIESELAEEVLQAHHNGEVIEVLFCTGTEGIQITRKTFESADQKERSNIVVNQRNPFIVTHGIIHVGRVESTQLITQGTLRNMQLISNQFSRFEQLTLRMNTDCFEFGHFLPVVSRAICQLTKYDRRKIRVLLQLNKEEIHAVIQGPHIINPNEGKDCYNLEQLQQEDASWTDWIKGNWPNGD